MIIISKSIFYVFSCFVSFLYLFIPLFHLFTFLCDHYISLITILKSIFFCLFILFLSFYLLFLHLFFYLLLFIYLYFLSFYFFYTIINEILFSTLHCVFIFLSFFYLWIFSHFCIFLSHILILFYSVFCYCLSYCIYIFLITPPFYLLSLFYIQPSILFLPSLPPLLLMYIGKTVSPSVAIKKSR